MDKIFFILADFLLLLSFLTALRISPSLCCLPSRGTPLSVPTV